MTSRFHCSEGRECLFIRNESTSDARRFLNSASESTAPWAARHPWATSGTEATSLPATAWPRRFHARRLRKRGQYTRPCARPERRKVRSERPPLRPQRQRHPYGPSPWAGTPAAPASPAPQAAGPDHLRWNRVPPGTGRDRRPWLPAWGGEGELRRASTRSCYTAPSSASHV